jgi:hypothetical protein
MELTDECMPSFANTTFFSRVGAPVDRPFTSRDFSVPKG